ncbi:MAG: TIGR03790 family protein [Bryobacterales bacterium]|nr:TIGR03790 family protein [Bryobacterales bacterium]
MTARIPRLEFGATGRQHRDPPKRFFRWFYASLAVAACTPAVPGQTSENVLLVVNQTSSVSRRIGDYYTQKRHVPLANVCRISAPSEEAISREIYSKQVEAPIARCLAGGNLVEKILYIVTTLEVPLKIDDPPLPAGPQMASVDSELTLLYAKLKGRKVTLPGVLNNPYFGKKGVPFNHSRFPMYLVTRLAGYDFDDVRGLIDRSLTAVNRGRIVLDLKSSASGDGNDWLRDTARLLPKERVFLEESAKVVYNERDVIAYASWGSNDPKRERRMMGFQWLPGAIMNEFVSTNGRTFKRPPPAWNIAPHWKDPASFFAGAPQTLTADYVHEGVTGASGHVYEPYLRGTPRPQLLIPAYLGGQNLAESFYCATPYLSWMNIVVGDPLCKLK